MGLHVASMVRRALDEAGRPEVPVYAISRFTSVHSADEFRARGIEVLVADLLDPAALAALPDLGTVYFLAGMKFGSADNPDLLRQFNEVMPTMVAERYRSACIVALSSGCVYPFTAVESGGSREGDELVPNGDYAASCIGRERAFAGASERHDIPVTLVRLNYSVEFRYGVLVDIAQKVLAGGEIDVTMGSFNAIWQRDAVEHIIRCVEIVRSPARPINITGLPILSVRDLAGRFASAFGKEAVIVGKEASTVWLADPSRAHRLFGRPEVDVEQMILWVSAWLANGGTTLGKPTKFERRDGKY